MDGVLVDSREAHYQAWRQLFAGHLGRQLAREDFLRTFGWRNLEILRELHDREISAEEAEELGREKEAAYRQAIRGSLRPMTGLLPLLGGLKARGFRLAVGTSAPGENLEVVLGELGLARWFQARVVGEEVREGKPHPQTFLLAAHRLGLAPSRCVVFEDAPAGVEAARRAGMACLALVGTASRRELGGADLVVDGLAEVDARRVEGLIRRQGGGGDGDV